MGRYKGGGYLFEWWMGDHYPKHIHVYKNRKEVAKVRVPEMIVLKGKLNRKLYGIIQELIDKSII